MLLDKSRTAREASLHMDVGILPVWLLFETEKKAAKHMKWPTLGSIEVLKELNFFNKRWNEN